MLEVRINTDDLKNLFGEQSFKFIDKAAVSAANKTMASLKTKTKKELSSFLSVPQKYIAKRIFIVKATDRSPSARLRVGDKGVPLGLFSPRTVLVDTPRGKRKAVSIDINGSRSIVPGGFLGKNIYGKNLIFARTGPSRYPIKVLFSKSLSSLFDSNGYLSTLQAFTKDTFEKNFNHDLEYFIAKATSK